ncbi:MAG TPA: class I SAM-dependent methyltransferase [Methanolinea sp.]|nr:class I SAM-dependent methyltransferase [Methanolinea sp.]
MVDAERFWAHAASVYDDGIDYVFGNSMRQILLDALKRESNLGRTVEFGCGTGYYTSLLAEMSGSVVATDIAEEMLERTRKRILGLPTVKVQKENCEKTTFPPSSFDTVFFGLTFHMVDGPATLAEMYRILTPGGRLIIVTPVIDGLRISDILRTILRNKRVFGLFRQPGTVLYTEQSLCDLVSHEGFLIQTTEHLQDPAHPGGFSGLYLTAGKA